MLFHTIPYVILPYNQPKPTLAYPNTAWSYPNTNLQLIESNPTLFYLKHHTLTRKPYCIPKLQTTTHLPHPLPLTPPHPSPPSPYSPHSPPPSATSDYFNFNLPLPSNHLLLFLLPVWLPQPILICPAEEEVSCTGPPFLFPFLLSFLPSSPLPSLSPLPSSPPFLPSLSLSPPLILIHLCLAF